MIDHVVVEPMTEQFVLWRGLHHGPLSHDTIDRSCDWIRRDGVMMTRFAVLLLLPLVAGCQEGRIVGLSASLGSHERGLWFDQDPRGYRPDAFGLKFDLVAGKMIRPVPKYWEPGNNPWQGGEPWFVLRAPMAGPFLSIAIGPVGMYVGFKTFMVDQEHRTPERYGRWMHENEFPGPNDVHVYLQPSFTIRRTRWR
jgi:hypothetical protein